MNQVRKGPMSAITKMAKIIATNTISRKAMYIGKQIFQNLPRIAHSPPLSPFRLLHLGQEHTKFSNSFIPLGTHSRYNQFFFTRLTAMIWSTCIFSLVTRLPQYTQRYLPCLGGWAAIYLVRYVSSRSYLVFIESPHTLESCYVLKVIILIP